MNYRETLKTIKEINSMSFDTKEEINAIIKGALEETCAFLDQGVWHLSGCGRVLSDYEESMKYCPFCGRKIKVN